METAAGDLRGKTCVVTGATSGIGKEVARSLARMGAEVILASRDPARGEAAREEIARTARNPSVSVRQVDLGSLASSRSFAEAVAASHPRIHVLVNDAAVYEPERRESPEGIELTWATNALAYHAVTEALLPSLRAAAPARVVNVASTFAEAPDLGDLEFRRRRYDGLAAYRQSKAANRMLTWALARRLAGSGVTAAAVHPGGVATGIYRNARGPAGWAVRAWVRLTALTPEQGADTPTWAAVAPELAGVSGRFYADRRERRCEFRDEEREERLREICDRMVARR